MPDDLKTVCHVLSDHHIKKVPVLDGGNIVGIINASNMHQVRIPEAGKSLKEKLRCLKSKYRSFIFCLLILEYNLLSYYGT